MALANIPFTVGNRKRYTLKYHRWLPEGVTLTVATVTSSSATATIDGVTHTADKVFFFVNNGVLNETFTATVQVTDTRGQIKNDTINFTVVAA